MADSKLTALTETTSPATSDDVYIVTTPGGTPASKRCTIANLRTAMNTPTDGAWTDYSATSTIVGWSSFANKQIYYKTVGKTVYCAFFLAGTSNSTTTTFTLPTAATTAPGAWVFFFSARDNSGAYVAAYGQVTQGSATITLQKDAALNNWTAGGTKEAYGQFWYVTA